MLQTRAFGIEFGVEIDLDFLDFDSKILVPIPVFKIGKPIAVEKKAFSS